MAWQFGAWLHAFTHGLFRPSEAAQVETRWHEVHALFTEWAIAEPDQRDALVAALAGDVAERFAIAPGHKQHHVIHWLTRELFDYEALFCLPDADRQRKRTIAELWDIREELTRQQKLAENFDEIVGLIEDAVAGFLEPIYRACPALLDEVGAEDGIAVPTDLLRSLGDIGTVTQGLLAVGFSEGLARGGVLARLADRLERNLIAASGGDPSDPAAFKRAPRWPASFDARTPEEMVGTYLGGTPLAGLFDQQLIFTIPTASRFEHQHIVAGSGHGKTQTLQYLIAQDLAAMENEKRSLIVLDSQGDLIRNIAQLDVFAPGGALHDKLVLIDPTDVEYPVSLNLFDVGQERLSGYAPLERERLTNSILELYDFVLGTLLDAQMTQKQQVIFRYVTRLMLHIPGATIHTLRELMEPGSEATFAEHFAKLEGTANHFFRTQFGAPDFKRTRQEVLRRLWSILENRTFERMFSHPRSKLDLFSEMNAGKVILINTAKDLLKEQGTEIFGRFFIAMIAQAAQERSVVPEGQRVPTMVYIDEAQDYFDRNIGLILAQARKYKVGMVLAHQYLGQLEPKLQEAFAANTAIKFAGGVSAKDARSLAPMLYTDPAFIEAQGKGSFAAHIRGVSKHAVPLTFPFGYLEGLPVMSAGERDAMREVMRKRYAVHHTQIGQAGNGGDGGGEDGEASGDPSAPNPSRPTGPGGGPSELGAEGGGKGGDGAGSDDSGKERPQRGQVDTTPGKTW